MKAVYALIANYCQAGPKDRYQIGLIDRPARGHLSIRQFVYLLSDEGGPGENNQAASCQLVASDL